MADHRSGSSFVFQVSAEGKVTQTQVSLGRRIGERIEVLNGVTENSTLVAQGAGFLADGDTVHIVNAAINSATNKTTQANKNTNTDNLAQVETKI